MSSPGTMMVHPTVSPRYYGYYLDGFREAFGWRVRLSTRGFPELRDAKAGMAAILPDGQRIFIAANDFAHVAPDVVDWADVVGQVNVDPDADRSPKVLSLGPGFGTPWRSAASLAAFVTQAGLLTQPRRVPAMLRDYLRHQAERAPLSSYRPGGTRAGTVYFLANLWLNAERANERRLRFLKAVESVPGLVLEGGFWCAVPPGERYAGHVVSQRVQHAEYLQRTRSSTLVFNTPAVHDCLGWKLGEFLALGKAIISTPLSREMPGRFAHGEHYHLVNDDQGAMVEAIELISGDDDYRRTLEGNARAYWEQYLAPASVARRVRAASEQGATELLHE